MRFPQAIWNLSGAEGVFLESKWQKNLNKHLSYSSCTFSAQSELQLDCQNWDDNLMNCLLFSIWVPLPQYLQYTCMLDTVQDFLIKLGIKPCILLEIGIFSLYHVIVRPTKMGPFLENFKSQSFQKMSLIKNDLLV